MAPGTARDDVAQTVERQTRRHTGHEVKLNGRRSTRADLAARVEKAGIEFHRAGGDDDLQRLAL
jgi:hypothetical protein